MCVALCVMMAESCAADLVTAAFLSKKGRAIYEPAQIPRKE
jgi:hypothetical protein